MHARRTYLAFGRLALALTLFVASSGFTMVLHSCLMENRACCDTMVAGGAMQVPPVNGGASVAKVPSACCENTIVGGLNRTTATLDNQATTSLAKTLLAIVSDVLPAAETRGGVSVAMSGQFRPPEPPPSGLYISNSSLLI